MSIHEKTPFKKKKEAIDQEMIFVIQILKKGLYPEYTKNQKLRKSQPIKKWKEDLNNSGQKRISNDQKSTALITRKIQIKTSMIYIPSK